MFIVIVRGSIEVMTAVVVEGGEQSAEPSNEVVCSTEVPTSIVLGSVNVVATVVVETWNGPAMIPRTR